MEIIKCDEGNWPRDWFGLKALLVWGDSFVAMSFYADFDSGVEWSKLGIPTVVLIR